MTSYSSLQTNVLAKFVDTTCIIKLRHLSSGRAGRAVKMMRAMETYKKQKNRYQLCLFLFNNNVDLKNNNRNIEKSFYLGARIAAINLFQVDLDKQ